MSSDPLFLPRPWLAVDRSVVQYDADRQYQFVCRARAAVYVKGDITDEAGRTVRRLAYWHQLVTLHSPSAQQQGTCPVARPVAFDA